MLAHKWNTHKKHMPFPCYVQPKLNGLRCLYQSGAMMSRSYGLAEPKFWHPNMLTHIREELQHLPSNLMLDGELYLHGHSLQWINGAAGVVRKEPNQHTPKIQYHVYDIFDEDNPHFPFEHRKELLATILYYHDRNPVHLVQTNLATSEPSAERLFELFKKQGYEGMMLRSSSAPYGRVEMCGNKENRWPCLLKRKDWLDEEVECKDYQITIGTKGERGFQMTCVRENGVEFNVGSGLSHSERDSYEHNPPIGRTVTVKYEMLSNDLKPLKPTILLVHD